MKINDTVKFLAPHYLSKLATPENGSHSVDTQRSQEKMAMAQFIVESLREQGFECEPPGTYAKFHGGVFFDIFWQSYKFWCALFLKNEQDWSLNILSMHAHDAILSKSLYDKQDLDEWRTVCEAVDKVLRSDARITIVRWFSSEEWLEEPEQKSAP